MPPILRFLLTGKDVMQIEPLTTTVLAEVRLDNHGQSRPRSTPKWMPTFGSTNLVHQVIGATEDLTAIKGGEVRIGVFLLVVNITPEKYRSKFHQLFPPSYPPFGLGGCAAFSVQTGFYDPPAVFTAMVFRSNEAYFGDFIQPFRHVLGGHTVKFAETEVIDFQANPPVQPQPAPQIQPVRTQSPWLNE